MKGPPRFWGGASNNPLERMNNMAVKTYKKGDKAKLSKNFSVYEFDDGKSRPCSCTTTLIDDKLAEYLQAIRDHFGKAVTITSGYRCPAYNSRPNVGGATGSRHTKGQAADIVVNGVAPVKVAAYAESIGVLGIGLYETDKDGHFVHIDTRTAKSFWYGQAQAYRSTFGGAASGTASTGSTAAESYTLRQFVTDVQKATGAGVDGLAGPKTLAKTVTVSKSRNRRHAVVLAVQKRLKALGYPVGRLDGVAGNKFDEALKAFQFDRDCVADGEATKGAETWQHLLGMK